MKTQLEVQQMIGCSVTRNRSLQHDIQFNNPFSAQLIRRGKVIGVFHGHNDVVVQGKNHMLDVTFGHSTPVTQVNPWYIRLISSSPTPVLSENDTLASHSGWTEFTSITGGVGLAWNDANAAAKIKGSNASHTFTATGSGTIYGIFIASAASGTSGILWATGGFDQSAPVTASDELKVTYGIRL